MYGVSEAAISPIPTSPTSDLRPLIIRVDCGGYLQSRKASIIPLPWRGARQGGVVHAPLEQGANLSRIEPPRCCAPPLQGRGIRGLFTG